MSSNFFIYFFVLLKSNKCWILIFVILLLNNKINFLYDPLAKFISQIWPGCRKGWPPNLRSSLLLTWISSRALKIVTPVSLKRLVLNRMSSHSLCILIKFLYSSLSFVAPELQPEPTGASNRQICKDCYLITSYLSKSASSPIMVIFRKEVPALGVRSKPAI